jgi:DNA polymerase elongation subunit (family B)
MPNYAIMGGLKLSYIGSGGEVEYVDAPKNPYGFVDVLAALTYMDKREFEEVELRSAIDGKFVYKFEESVPAKVGNFGKELEKKGFRSYETDIPYVRRMIIDREVEIDYRGVVYLDIELDDSRGWRRHGEMPLLSYAYSFGGGDGVHFVYAGKDSKAVGELIDEMVNREVYTLVGWNVDFDHKHLSALVRSRESREVLKRVELIDMRSLYMFHKKGIGSYSLSNVAAYEGLGEKGRGGKVSALSRDELEKYNVNDVELLLKLEERYNFIQRTLKMAKELKIPVSDMMRGETVVWDYLILRRLRELGYVAPRKQYWRKSGYEGAYCLEPEPGLKNNVAVFDFVSLYPSIIMRDKVDVFRFNGEVVPFFMAEFFMKKNEAEARGDMIGREMYKILMNSCYGMFSYEGSRYFDESKAAHVTKKGREALLSLVEFLGKIGVKVYFGDTDSVFIDAGVFGDLKALETLINEKFYPLQVKLDKKFASILFLGREGKGVKKRYIGLTVDGKLVERGIETRRGDWCEYTKKVMREVALMILNGEPMDKIEDKIVEYRRQLLSGKIPPEQLLITKHLRENLKEYKTKPAWLKLWEKQVKDGTIPAESREISFWIGRNGQLVDNPTGISYQDYWEKQILPPLKRLTSSLHLYNTSKLSDYMQR